MPLNSGKNTYPDEHRCTGQVTRPGKPKVNRSINEIREDDFEVISSDNGSIGVAINIPYSEAVKIKGKGIDWRSAAI